MFDSQSSARPGTQEYLLENEEDQREWLSTTLSTSANEAFEMFCFVPDLPKWVPVLQSARVIKENADRTAQRIAFVGRLQGASIGYMVDYVYSRSDLSVRWSTPSDSQILVAGEARFITLSPKACLLQYALSLHLPGSCLPPWQAPFDGGHPPSLVLNEFREYVSAKTRWQPIQRAAV